ncbi:MAG: protein translocase subunit SecD [Lachnospiraceae bacterium]|nr:protein translocase subunit SecD [Lachnospiraceae bacterium]
MSKRKSIIAIVLIVLCSLFFGYTDVAGFGTNKAGSAKDIKLGLDLAGGVSITYQVVGDGVPSIQDMSDTIEKLKKRVEKYSTESSVYQEGADRINIEIPGVYDANAILQELGRPGTLYFLRQNGSDGTPNYSGYYSEDGIEYVLNRSIEEIDADGGVVVVGTDVIAADAGQIQDSMQNSEYVVSLTFSPEGSEKFRLATKDAAAKGETIAIYYDGAFVMVPNVKNEIPNGNAQISPMASFEEADKIASTIRIGGLKLELEELRSNVVGASLGQEAIGSSLKAGVVGFAIVVVFMIAVYFMFGLTSAIALSLYAVLEILLINGFGITLTLPGIAGIILSVGMAVDANVIIFARIREELRTGKTVESAVKVAYSKAMSAILDGNITTLIAAAVLWIMGSGSIKGFAQTLALGIVLSMFTAVVITKLLLKALIGLGITNPKVYGVAKENKRIDFVSKRGIFFAASGLVIAAGLVVMLSVNSGVEGRGHSLNFSLEFLGGTQTTVPFNEDYSLDQINSMMVGDVENIVGDANVVVTKVQGSNEVIFKTKTLSAEQRSALDEYFTGKYNVDLETIKAESISSVISKESQKETIIAVIVACVCMLIYIWFRFKDIRFGAASVLALAHDVLVTLAFYAFAYVSVGSTFVACMLTIVGYSINATIVVFDRIRENLNEATRKTELKDIINDSISATLSRSIFTSLTTFVMVVCLYIFGVSSVKEFALPLMVGIICGTYSSVCLAGSMWYVFRSKFAKKED